MFRGQGGALAGAIVGALASAVAAAMAFAEAPEPGKDMPRNTGAPSDGAFYMDFTQGFDRVNHVLSNWNINEEWLAAAFKRDNVVFDSNGMTLTARRQETAISDYTSAEFQRAGVFGYGRYEVVMRTARGAGVVTTFFVHTGDPHDEIDFEILGRSTASVHTNFYGSGERSPLDIGLAFDAAGAEHLYAFEWLPNRIAWYVDGVLVREVTSATPGARIPTTTSRVMASVWVAKGQVAEWAGEPDFDAASATYRCMSHVPLGQSGRQCSETFTPPR